MARIPLGAQARRILYSPLDMGFDWNKIDAELSSLLEGMAVSGPDHERTEYFAKEIAARHLGPESNLLREPAEPVGSDGIDSLAALRPEERAHHIERGRAALRRGEIAVVVLNGGMATRFGGVVKGIVDAIENRSFLEIKLAQALRQGPVPFLVMNSFATHRNTQQFLETRGLVDRVASFLQSVAIRLTPEGELFRDVSGALSLYAPGHGDFLEAIRDSGSLAELRARGVRALLLSNVDNLGAELDPAVIGYHLAHGRPLTVELTESQGNDSGGTVVRVNGRVQVVEGFRLAPDFPFDRVAVINTNTFVMSIDALGRAYPLSWFYVEKTVEGRKAVQMERLVGELSAFVPTAYLASPRGGRQGRFFPVKTPEDLEGMRQDAVLRERFG